ncbi:formyltransferase family protein [[Clostridium] colinum]|uniref:formyltransferase family protein n=1 Tax=[Clostridium] colinum TaxID=36835 RepID=UPI0020249C2E|nr:formyltransferase family protein [[Clostridium] colinum]
MDSNNFNCIIVGNGILTKLCIEILIKKFFNIILVVTSNEDVKDFCKSKNINIVSDKDINIIKEYDFDYLFSIVYLNIIPEDIINIARIKAINYHDSLLPSYAGVNSTSWAIINKEQYHGITWHTMTKELDKGAILLQKPIKIDKKETAYSLNLKCLYSGFNEFKHLVNDILNNNLKEVNQDFTLRSYFGKYKKPLYCGIINITDYNDVNQVDCLIRGLNFEKINNILATAKICINNNFYIIDSYYLQNEDNFENNNYKIILTFNNNYIIIDKIRDIYGNIIELDKEFKFDKFKKLYVQNINEKNNLLSIGNYFEQICKYESYWVQKFNKIKNIKNEILEVNDEIYIQIKEIINSQNLIIEDKIILAIILVNKLIFKNNTICIGYDINFSNYNNLYSNVVPFIIEFDNSKININEIICKIKKEKEMIKENITYCKDIFFRYKEISKKHDKFEINICKDIRNISGNFNILIKHDKFEIINFNTNNFISKIINKIL